jgi:hypothetical protein
MRGRIRSKLAVFRSAFVEKELLMTESPEERSSRISNEANASFIDKAWDILCEVEAGYPKESCHHTSSKEGSDLWDATVQEVEERRAAGLPDQTR